MPAMPNFRLEPAEAPVRRSWLTVAAGAVILVVVLLWADAALDRPPGRMFVGLAQAAPFVILAYLVATAAEWLTRSEKDEGLDQGAPRWIAEAHGLVSTLFLAAAGAQLILLAMLLAAFAFAPLAIPAVAPTLILTVIGSVIGVMVLRAPLYLATVAMRLGRRLSRR